MPQLQPRRLTTAAVAIVGGLLTDTAFPQRSWWPMAIIGVALLVLALRRDSARWAAAVGFLWGISFFLPHIWWANEAVGVIPWIALSVAEAGIVAATCAAWVWVRRGTLLQRLVLGQAAVFGVVWAVGEQLRQVWPFGGFPWGRLAFSQTDSPLLRLASLGGAPLVSAVVAALGLLLASVAVTLRQADTVRLIGAPAAVAAVLGLSLLVPLGTHGSAGQLRVGAVQGNVAEPGLGAFANAYEVLNNHVSGTEQLAEDVGAGGVDLVVWPENSSDYNPRAYEDARVLVEQAVAAVGVPLLFGTDRYVEAGDEPGAVDERYNDMVLWLPGEGPVEAYSKQIPAAFAEYIPMREVARIFSSAVDLVGTDMARGTEIAVVDVPVATLERDVPVGTIICFEVAYDALIRESVVGGAEVLFVPTNNASFGYSAESEQQLAMSRFRAVEHGRATIQISTVGVSGVIAPNGVVLETTELFTADQLVATVPLRTELTISDRLGDAPVVAFTLFTVLALLTGIATAPRRKRRR
ncbi:apolipoprotein N-acyltransferase [Pseudactinotalea suaedae]|uniref:apolipoprotein N-acyltransferase n=1 Tax=Pseudactinotalea suaedae TaxID=1524924 RepID=UPI001F4F81AF|nr:apolipoprotein N-acyltransferase [Pseudactinotalea suaedae]